LGFQSMAFGAALEQEEYEIEALAHDLERMEELEVEFMTSTTVKSKEPKVDNPSAVFKKASEITKEETFQSTITTRPIFGRLPQKPSLQKPSRFDSRVLITRTLHMRPPSPAVRTCLTARTHPKTQYMLLSETFRSFMTARMH
jgi:hypothetical protein